MTTTETMLDRLEKEPAPGWRPEPGDAIAGEVVDVTSGESTYGVYPLLVIRKDNGDEIALHAFHGVLKRELAKRQVRVGDKLAVKYLGKHEPKAGGQTYEAYRLVHQQSAANAETLVAARLRAGRSAQAPAPSEAPVVPDDYAEEPF